jgi:hypothetical protein
VSFAAITLCVASQRVFIVVYSVIDSVRKLLDIPSYIGMNQNIRVANESFQNVAKFKYFETTLTNEYDTQDEIKSRLNSGNACYHSV